MFKIKDLGFVHYFLGLKVIHTFFGLILTQRKFIKELFDQFGDPNASPVTCPLDNTVKLHLDEGALFHNSTLYRQIVGKLNFLTNTRPDLAFAVQHLSQFMLTPRISHYQAVQHVLRYLKGQPNLGILLHKAQDSRLEAYCDSDLAAYSHTRKFVSGYVIFFGKSIISWKSRKQGTIALSSAEAEYRSLRRLIAELAWLTRLLAEFTIDSVTPVSVKCDKQATIYIAKNLVFHERTKYIEIDCYFVQAKLLDGLISLSYIPTAQ